MKKHSFWPKKLKLHKIFHLKPITTVATAIVFLALTFLPLSTPKLAFAHPGTVIDSFTNEDKIASKSNTVVTGGQVKLDLDTEELDYMEYSTNALAQAAYVSSDTSYTADLTTPAMTSNTAPSPFVTSASSQLSADYAAWKAFEHVNGTHSDSWTATGAAEWIKFDFGSGVTKTITKYTITSRKWSDAGTRTPKDWTFQGSNNDSDWTTLDTQTSETGWGQDELRNYTFNNSTAYRYYKVDITANNGAAGTSIGEIELMETHFQSYSEDTIKEQGSYSLKATARATDSLDDTLTRTVAPTIDLSDKALIKLDVRASRTGTNLQAQIHDSGGTTTIYNISISTANTWETKSWDISGVANEDKDAIDRIIFKVTNASADNTFYIDNMRYGSGGYYSSGTLTSTNLLLGLLGSLDYMEYSSDALAQTAYVSSDTAYTADLTSGQTITASSRINTSNIWTKAFDNNFVNSAWLSATATNEWISCQFSSSKVIKRIAITQDWRTGQIKHCKLEGSNNGSDWTKISANGWSGQASQYNTDEILMSSVVLGVGTIDFDNSTEYTYYRVYGYDSYNIYIGMTEIEMMETHLQSYSEDTIKEQGAYSLKAVARATDSLDDTLTRTVAPTIDLSDKNEIKFDVRASRTGTNLQAQIHDSGGTTTTYDISISTADTWETKTWDISEVDNTDKDVIDQIIFKVTNADADNTFYVDNIYPSGLTIGSIDSFNYNASSIGGGLKVQFSQDGSDWYKSDGTSGYDDLAAGTHSIDLFSLGWLGANFYYKAQFTSGSTPVLDEISVSYSEAGGEGNGEAVPEFTTITFIIAAVCGFGIYFLIRQRKEKKAKV